jgi:hypothetical protein
VSAIVELDAQLVRQREQRRVVAVDELAAELDELAVVGVVQDAEHAPADARGRFVHRDVHARLLQAVCAVQPGDARADHDHPLVACALVRVAARARAEHARGRQLQRARCQLPPRQMTGPGVQTRRRAVSLRQRARCNSSQLTEQSSSCHESRILERQPGR